MIAASRSLTATGTALVAAGLIATTAVATSAVAPVQVTVPPLSAVAVELQSSVLDIFAFPAIQQAIVNEVEYVALWAAGLALSSAGLTASLAALPATVITAVGQVFTGDLLGALTTVEQAAIGAAEATLVPLVGSRIEIGQIQLAIQSALLLAQPVAAVEFGAGLFTAFDLVTRAFITAGQDFVDAVLSFNIVNIVNSVVDGVTGVVTSFGAGGQAAVDGIVAAQTTLATALAARPAPIVEEMTVKTGRPLIGNGTAVGPQSASASLRAVETESGPVETTDPGPVVTTDPAPVVTTDPAPVETAADIRDKAPAASSAADSSPRRTSVRATQRESAAATADTATADADTDSPTKTVGKRAARAAAAN